MQGVHARPKKQREVNNKPKETDSNRLSVVAFRSSGAGVRASTPSLFTCPPPSPTAHGHLQSPAKEEKMAGGAKCGNTRNK